MKTIEKIMVIIAVCSGTLLAGAAENPRVLIETELGDITLEIFLEQAPITAANFLRYVDENLYKGSSFYRVVTMENQPDNDIKIEVIQGGLGSGEEKKRFPPIEHETTAKTGIKHEDGVISMARSKPGSASSEIFICINDQPELDFGGKRNPDGQGFSAFGKVIEGIDVVRKIQKQPADGQTLNPQIRIHSVGRVSVE
jgi:peptidyl-prolyl cis-trans isomerase A (cyclophilin A)